MSRLPVLVAAPLLITAMAVPAAAHENREDRFDVDLQPVNQQAEGRVRLTLEGDRLEVRLKADDLDGGVHLAHLHGVQQAENECPELAVHDTDGNGLVDILEGLVTYGPVQLTLSNGLNDTGTRIKYRRDFATLDSGEHLADLGDLSQYANVVHGVDLDGDGVATNPDVDADGDGDLSPHSDNEISMPALCGTVEQHWR